jgi:zinc/manganese transport system substrate-binding protein
MITPPLGQAAALGDKEWRQMIHGRRRWLRLLALTLVMVAGGGFAPARADAPPINVIASFSIIGDMVREVGGDRVRVTTLVGADGDAHVYQPTPADARQVAAARIVFVNGLGFEGWLDRLVKAAAFTGPVVVVSAGVKPLTIADDHDHGHGHKDGKGGHDHGSIDPHAWQSLANGALYVRNIQAALAAADPAGAAVYQANAERYLAEMAALDQEVRQAIGKLPPERRVVVTSHDAFGYFTKAYGLRFLAPEGVSTESEASAKDVARLIRQIRAERIPAVFMENITDPRLIEQIRRETGAVAGGVLYSDALTGPDGGAPTYLLMFRHNVATLTRALGA